ncbi:hypothetical protein [Vampirovibrio sp.]|uniref:hypothetical protein n=1 Tax=Vampirovibrio sp. TaxID=2717857 RepID=UPI003594891B
MTFSVFQAVTNQSKGKWAFLLGLSFALITLGGCRSDQVSVDPKDPNGPQFTYRKDELALLQMSADDIQELERNKRYGTIYDDYASESFKKGVGRRQFMIMSNCVESFLGDLQEYDRNDIGFRREFLKTNTQGKPKADNPYMDVLNRKVQRALGSIEEQLVFVPNGLSFQLNGLYWIAKDKSFLQCMAQSGELDRATAPAGEEPLAEKSETPSASEATQPKTTTAAGTETETTRQPSQTGGEQPLINTESPTSAAPVPTDGASSLEAKPVQKMKPAEIDKAPLKARPAGAGAVVDQRPVSAKAKEAQRAKEENEKRRIELEAPGENQVTVPLPTAPGSDD